MVRSGDVVVTLGREAHVQQVPGTRSRTGTRRALRTGIEGIERMRLVRDDIARRVDELRQRLLVDMDLERPHALPERTTAYQDPGR
jgi:arsenate-mycothiol transferase